jgi:hypothetical protein
VEVVLAYFYGNILAFARHRRSSLKKLQKPQPSLRPSYFRHIPRKNSVPTSPSPHLYLSLIKNINWSTLYREITAVVG